MSTRIRIAAVGAFVRVTGQDVKRPFFKDAVVDVDKDIAAQLIEQGAAVMDDTPPTPSPPVGFDVAAATDEELDGWLKQATVPEVLEAAGSDPHLAERLLDAEIRVNNGKPRKGVEGGLVVIGRPA